MSLSTYAELQIENEEEFQKKLAENTVSLSEKDLIRKYLELVNLPVPDKWIKTVKVGNNRTIKYIPIDKIEHTLTRVYGIFWKREILHEEVMLNTVISRVRLHFKIPGTTLWLFHDGAGGSIIKVAKDELPSNLTLMASGAIQQAYPSSVSYALSNAAEKIGKLFGRDLNKDNAEEFTQPYDPNPAVSPSQVSPSQVSPSQVSPSQVSPSQVSNGITVIPPQAAVPKSEFKLQF